MNAVRAVGLFVLGLGAIALLAMAAGETPHHRTLAVVFCVVGLSIVTAVETFR